MATLYDYINGLTAGGQSVIWSNNPLSESQVQAAGGRPYIVVTEMGESPMESLYGNQEVAMATVDVTIYQAASNDTNYVDRSDAMQLFFDVQDAVHNVDSWIYNQPLIAMHRMASSPPIYNRLAGGLLGNVRFRLLYPKG